RAKESREKRRRPVHAADPQISPRDEDQITVVFVGWAKRALLTPPNRILELDYHARPRRTADVAHPGEAGSAGAAQVRELAAAPGDAAEERGRQPVALGSARRRRAGG